MTLRANTSRPRRSAQRSVVALALVAMIGVLAGCGAGGTDSSKHIQEPVVRNFSPFMSPRWVSSPVSGVI